MNNLIITAFAALVVGGICGHYCSDWCCFLRYRSWPTWVPIALSAGALIGELVSTGCMVIILFQEKIISGGMIVIPAIQFFLMILITLRTAWTLFCSYHDAERVRDILNNPNTMWAIKDAQRHKRAQGQRA